VRNVADVESRTGHAADASEVTEFICASHLHRIKRESPMSFRKIAPVKPARKPAPPKPHEHKHKHPAKPAPKPAAKKAPRRPVGPQQG
jgi:hypothetical protein